MIRICAAALAAFLWAQPASAQMAMVTTLECYDTKDIEKQMLEKYHATVVGFGVNRRGDLIRLYVSDKRKFGVLISSPNGLSCLQSTGDNWTADKPAIQGNPT